MGGAAAAVAQITTATGDSPRSRSYPAAVRADRGLNRLITFADAVAAIAITLLVLPLIELLAAATPSRELPAVLAETRTALLVFFLSFAVIGRLWYDHHRLVEHVGAYDPAFVLVNFAWVLTIVLLPFATQMIGVYGHDRLAVAAYLVTMTVSSACLTVMTLLVWRRPCPTPAGTGRPADPPTDIVVGHRDVPRRVPAGHPHPGRQLARPIPGTRHRAFLVLVTGPVECLLRRRARSAPG